jgi:HTH-type transcriptional regulator, glycine betaine synthesis regulator
VRRGPEPGTRYSEPGTRNPELADLQERFVLHWGEMASTWGINRTMGQIHALLYISPEPLSTDEIMERLKISRGNASMNLRGLEDWGVIQRVHYTGDRREYFGPLTDVWDLFRNLVRERKRREFDPTLRSLKEFLGDAGAVDSDDPGLRVYRERLGSLLTLLEFIQGACDRFLPCDPHELPRLFEVEVEGLD